MKNKLLLRTEFVSGLLIVGFFLLLQFRHLAGANASVSESDHSHRAARLSKHISVQAAHRGNPWINLSDGREIDPDFIATSSVVNELEKTKAWPLSLASGEFDEDGVPDLVCGYKSTTGGVVTLQRGNVDSIYPNSPEA